ncbi:MAG TPA: hypothetical protein VFG34_05680 [Sphingopyxis sp.]|nr:hypothetical protein [Sphingopyxis sp.]
MKNIIMAAMASASLFVSPLAMATEPYVASNLPHPFEFSGSFDVVKSIPIFGCQVEFKILSPNDSYDGKHAATLPWNPPLSAGEYHTDISNMKNGDISLSFSNGSPPVCAPGVVYRSFSHASYVSTGYNQGIFTLHDVYIETPLTPVGCKGDLSLIWNGGAQTLTAPPGSSIPDVTNPSTGLPCQFSGVLNVTLPREVVFSAPGDANH